ncbi:MAG: YciI family protein [bacterium]
MKFMLLIYNDHSMLDTLPQEEGDEMMRTCLSHADELKLEGSLIESQMLMPPATAKTMRARNGRMTVVDGPFAEVKEMLGGFNLIEAKDMDEAVAIASAFPWSKTGSIEIRPVQEIADVRQRVFA